MGSMEKGGLAEGRAMQNGRNLKRPRTALVLYGSETGNAQDVAEEIGRLTERLRFETTVLDLDSADLRSLLKHTVVIVAISTTGQGEMPQNARLFWKILLSGALRPGLLKRVRFASFGLGDSSYPKYNTAHRMLHGRLVQLGAQTFCARGEGNEQHPEGHSKGFRDWIVTLQQSLQEGFPFSAGQEMIADDVFLEPKWKLAVVESNGHAESSSRESLEDAGPSPQPLPIKCSHAATLLSNNRVTPDSHFQDVRLMDLRLKNDVSYGPGAVAVIYPKNFPGDVREFITLMQWDDVADKPFELVSASKGGEIPSPLRHVSKTRFTIRDLLSDFLDIMSIPRRSFFANLLYFAGTKTEDERYQRDRLVELANPELIDELWDYTTRPKRTILEVMQDFTTIKVPYQYVLSVIPIMRGRQFSVASGGRLCKTEQGRTRVQLLVAIANPPSPIIKYRKRHGVCTRYIVSLDAGRELNIGMQEGYLDVQPRELDNPVVMIGPGTGVAPMRSMTYQRLAWALEDPSKSEKPLEGDLLFFGCRNEDADYFFKDEWADLAEKGLHVFPAFSQDKKVPRQYVQELIRKEASIVRKTVVDLNGKIYVCGSSGNMPKGVREALLDVLTDQSSGMDRQDAEAYLDRMEKDGRYKQETW